MSETSMVALKFIICDVLPTIPNISPNAFYIYKPTTNSFARLYKSTLNGSTLIPFTNPEIVDAHLFYLGSTPPAEGSGFRFWYSGSDFKINAPVDSEDNWVSVSEKGNNGSRWFTGSEDPSEELGVEGDFYLRDGGSVWSKGPLGWISTEVNLKGKEATLRVIKSNETSSLELEDGGVDEFLVIEDKGLYKHRVGSTETADGSMVIASNNGRWHIEALGVALVRTLVRQVLAEELGS